MSTYLVTRSGYKLTICDGCVGVRPQLLESICHYS